MNTEINFLEKHPKKYIIPLILGIFFVLLLACVVTVLLFQKDHYETKIDTQKNHIAAIETALADHQEEVASEKKLKQMQQEVQSIQEEGIPNVALYNQVLDMLPTTGQLISYEFQGEDHLLVEAMFDTLKATANYVSKLLAEPYVLNTDLTSIDRIGKTYQATLTIDLDNERLVKELGKNE